MQGNKSSKKKDAYYFSHDANAQDDHKCMHLIEELGMEGYGIYFALIEKLRSEPNYTLPYYVLRLFAIRWRTSQENVEAVVNNFNLFVVEKDFFFSLRLKRSMEEKTARALNSINHRWKNTNVQQSNNARNTTDIRKDTIKGKESKVKERKGVAPPSLRENIIKTMSGLRKEIPPDVIAKEVDSLINKYPNMKLPQQNKTIKEWAERINYKSTLKRLVL